MGRDDESIKKMVSTMFGMKTDDSANDKIDIPPRFEWLEIQAKSENYIPEMYADTIIIREPTTRKMLDREKLEEDNELRKIIVQRTEKRHKGKFSHVEERAEVTIQKKTRGNARTLA